MEETRQYSAVRLFFVIVGVSLLAACAEEPELSCETITPIEGVTPSSEMSLNADDIAKLSSKLHASLSSDRGLAGFPGSIARKVAGTDSYRFAVELRELERLVALQVAREQATRNGGPPLVDPTQPWACEMLAVSVASLDQGQSTGQLLRNIKQIEEHFGREYPYREGSKDPE